MSLSSSNFFCGTRNKTFTNSLLWKTDVDFSERLYKTNMSASLPVTKAICFAFLNQLLYTIIEVEAWSEIREISQTEYLAITPRACVGHG